VPLQEPLREQFHFLHQARLVVGRQVAGVDLRLHREQRVERVVVQAWWAGFLS
jgi:hypothetical protein